jgi:hypothetical protein
MLTEAFGRLKLNPDIEARNAPLASATAPVQPTLAGQQPLLGRPSPMHRSAQDRFGGDAWLLVRRDLSRAVAAAGKPSYGRSQAGAVLRYRLALSSRHRPVAYARVTRALAGPREMEVAAGIGARPFAGLPLSFAGEMRVSDSRAGRELRPAIFAVTELPPAELPRSLQVQTYIQTGYVGGRFATAFVDGQARIDATVAPVGRNELRTGLGVWGGAQKQAARLDIGPSATLAVPLGRVQSQVAVGYRFRIAGDAGPSSGPALTISAGF